MRTYCLIALLCVVPSLALAQGQRLSGRVIDRDGNPVGSAEVTLVSFPVPVRPELGTTHTVKARTGDRGRFRCEVAPGRLYSAWARLPGERPVFTNVVEHVTGGLVISLERERFTRSSRTVRVTGLEAWKHRGPFRVFAVGSALCAPAIELELDGKGEARVPDLPGKFCHVELHDRDGQGFLNEQIRYTLAKDGESLVAIRVPKPLPISVTVIDRESKNPIQGALLRRRAFWSTDYSEKRLLGYRSGRDNTTHAGVTDELGRCSVEFPFEWSDQQSWRFQLQATAPGYMTSQGELRNADGRKFYSLEAVAGGPPKLTIELAKAFVLTGRVVDREGKPIPDLVLLRPSSGAQYVDQGGASWSHHADSVTTTDASGRFTVTGLLPCELSRLTALPTEAQSKRLLPAGPEGAAEAYPVVHLWHDVVDKRDASKVDLGNLGSAKLCWVRIEVVDAQGESVSFPKVNIQMANKAENSSSGMFDLRGNRRGLLFVPLAAGDYQIVNLDADMNGYSYAEVTVEPAKEHIQVLRLKQKKWAWIEGKVLDTKGKPVGFATIESWGYGVTGQIPNLIPTLNQYVLPVTANATGEFRLPFIPHAGYRFSLAATANGTSGTTQELSGADSQTDVVLTVPAR